MTLDQFRAEYPEYDDLPDVDVMEMIIGPEPEREETELFQAPGIESALADIAGLLTKVVEHIKKEKPAEKREQLTGLLVGIEKAIGNISVPAPAVYELVVPEQKQIKSLKIKRDELGYIQSVDPIY